MNRKTVSVCALFAFFGMLMLHAPVFAQDAAPQKPERQISMSVEYPGIEVTVGKSVNMNISFHNGGRQSENVEVWVAGKPEGWDTTIKTYKFTVNAVNVPASDTPTNITFEAEPSDSVKPGKYEFQIQAKTRDGAFQMAETIAVNVVEEKAKKEEKTTKDITLNTAYPELRGPTDMTFEFSLEVASELSEDANFNLFAEGPKDWDINFKPAYENKYISSLQIKANQRQNVSVEIKPAFQAQAGDYPVKVKVVAGESKAEIDLMVKLTGTYKLEAGTPNGLLSLDAQHGKTTNLSIYVKNMGSAPNNNISFMSFKPENWNVEFKPETIDALAPGELKQVEVLITPSSQALVGDYSVAVDVQGEKASKTLEFRTTVKASAAWGWVGILIIVAVIAGLTGLFRTLGRR
ncbi:hypothetical protein U14_04667 [Candidatus Moduliflexus flocculans]|uniref:Alpha-galactosidase NEW3 domain-containing protein n=1 Tax=Candidatus Moduliflexus flocculans TaxID=1499966 RepID=A0A0S6W580_9BACT|nr:hypothetical protein U14_04667 [Candidatus Moduliflexus flocculans]